MSSRRIVATCAAMVLIVGLGSWYSVSAFPLRSSDQAATPGSLKAGPLELRAHAVTPENPIPRRVHYEPAAIPDSIDSVRGNVGVRVTLDDVGRVAESRMISMSFDLPEFSVEASEVSLKDRGMRSLVGNAQAGNTPSDPMASKQKLDALIDSALTSVRQWRYDPPFEAPLTFTVQVPFTKGLEVMAFKPAREGNALRVGGEIKPPIKIKDVRPLYPPVAREAGVSGVVIIEVRIGSDGFVEEAHVLKSIPLLDEAALDAVKQWQFTPTLMNGVATPVIMTVTMNFTQQ
jgi:TonB family protein